MNNNIINESDKFNFLGLHINSRLTWDSHIKEISNKIIRTTCIIKKLQLTFPKNILLSIYGYGTFFYFLLFIELHRGAKLD